MQKKLMTEHIRKYKPADVVQMERRQYMRAAEDTYE